LCFTISVAVFSLPSYLNFRHLVENFVREIGKEGSFYTNPRGVNQYH
jgi:hypothetical protein